VLAANGSGTPANSVCCVDGEETALDMRGREDRHRRGYSFSVDEDKLTDVPVRLRRCRSVAPSGTQGYVLRRGQGGCRATALDHRLRRCVAAA